MLGLLVLQMDICIAGEVSRISTASGELLMQNSPTSSCCCQKMEGFSCPNFNFVLHSRENHPCEHALSYSSLTRNWIPCFLGDHLEAGYSSISLFLNSYFCLEMSQYFRINSISLPSITYGLIKVTS